MLRIDHNVDGDLEDDMFNCYYYDRISARMLSGIGGLNDITYICDKKDNPEVTHNSNSVVRVGWMPVGSV